MNNLTKLKKREAFDERLHRIKKESIKSKRRESNCTELWSNEIEEVIANSKCL